MRLPTPDTQHPTPATLVVGGGMAGMQASLLLAAVGVHVYLVDRAPAIGGHQPLLDKTFPTDSCGLCFMSPRPAAYCPFVECERSEQVSVLPSTEVAGVSGEAGDFTVRLLEKARGVDRARCTGCGRCADVCPLTVRSDFGGGLEDRKAIHRPFPQAVPDSYLIDWSACTCCGRCVDVCGPQAIDLGQRDTERTVRVGAVILAPGFKPVDAGLNTEYGYGLYPNVVTSIQFERMLSRGGPTGGEIRRLSDGAVPAKVAFIQCVGSRDPACGREYCSSVCCMYAAKQAALLKQRAPEVSAVVFQMDMRAFGKGYDRYAARVQVEAGVEYRRSAVAAVKQVPGSKSLLLSFAGDDGLQRTEAFDLVVLSVGVEPSEGVADLAKRLGVPVNRHGFLESGPLFQEETPVRGVFVAGGGREPMDVADAVAEGAAAAESAARLLGVMLEDRPLPVGEGRDEGQPPLPSGEGRSEGPRPAPNAGAPRVGVLLCECGGEIGGRIDLQALAERASSWPEVACAAVVDGLCRCGSGDLTPPLPFPRGEARGGVRSANPVRRAVEEHGVNRLVVAACARRKIEGPLETLAMEAGLASGMLELANLREQCAWVHADDRLAAESKAETLVAMSVARTSLAEPVALGRMELRQSALVVGGGAAGLVAATALADHGVEVWLAEKEAEAGGDLRHPDGKPDGSPAADLLGGLRRRIDASDRIHLLTGTEVVRTDGRLGAFTSTLRADGQEERRLDHSVAVLATGAQETEPEEHLLGSHSAVMTLSQMERRLQEDEGWAVRHPAVAMILCAGSPKEGQGYCSRTCCSQAVVNALRLKELNPNATVYVLYREMRTYGFQEAQYEAARRAGVTFLRFDARRQPDVIPQGERVQVMVVEPRLGRQVLLEVDALALAVGVRPRPVDGLARSLGVEMDEDGFFVEANVKTRSTEARRSGVFLCGGCQSPRSLADTVVHAKAAAMRALALLRPGEVQFPATIATVNERICSGCGLCVEVCAYGARELDPEKNVSRVVEALCQGCGACAAACPNGATQQSGFTGRQMLALLDAAID